MSGPGDNPMYPKEFRDAYNEGLPPIFVSFPTEPFDQGDWEAWASFNGTAYPSSTVVVTYPPNQYSVCCPYILPCGGFPCEKLGYCPGG